MGLPKVAIIGRPNVGKSSLLNALAGRMISIVDPTAGVTRDRVSTFVSRADHYFELIDTGGYGVVDIDHLSEHIEQQILRAIESANLVLFIVDIREGLVPLDGIIASLLRKYNLDVIGVANKADTAKMFPAAGEFLKLGFGEFVCVSAQNNLNKAELLDKIFEKLAVLKSVGAPTEPVMKIAIVGKRNAGKSTLVNSIVGEERVIVSETPGTTRDAVDVRFEKDGKTIVVIDTAGIKKTTRTSNSIEFYASVRVFSSIRRADVVLLIIDATVPVSQIDKKLAKIIVDEYKACILVVNKWDLAKGSSSTEDYERYLTDRLPMLKYAPIAFTTASKSKNVQSVLDLAAELFKQATMQISTRKLNKAFESMKSGQTKTGKHGAKGPKVYYSTQISTNPITILMFVNNPGLFDENHRRYLLNRLQSTLPFAEVPVKLLVRSHRSTDTRHGSMTNKKPSRRLHRH